MHTYSLCYKPVQVPEAVPPRDLRVLLEPYRLHVANCKTGEVYFKGQLERGIIPEESVWSHGQGEGEDGFMFYLRKMNLELLRK